MKKYLLLMLALLLAGGCVILRGPGHPDADARGRWDRFDARRAASALVSYRLNLELIHITSNRKAYIGNWQIKKLVEL